MNTFELSKDFFAYSFDNREVKPIHIALYFFCIDLNNRLGWSVEFGLPTTMTMKAIGVSSYKTYIKAFNDLERFGFIEIYERSQNQYTSNIIGLVKKTNALSNSLSNSVLNQEPTQCSSTIQLNASINKPETLNLETLNLETDSTPSFLNRGKTAKAMKQSICFESKEAMLSEISKTEYADYLIQASGKWRSMSEKAQELFLEEFAGKNATIKEYGNLKETYQAGIKTHMINSLKYHEPPKEKTASTYAYYYKIGNKEKKHNDKAMWERDKRNFGNGQGYSEIQVQEA